jgi:hypothetical protein
LNRLAANAVSQVYRATALRAVQGAVMLYERREIILVTTRIKVREYLAMLNDIARRRKRGLKALLPVEYQMSTIA